MTSEEKLDMILIAVDVMSSTVAHMSDRLTAIEARVSAPAPSPGVVTAPSIWDGLAANQPLAAYEVTPQGWVNNARRATEFPGDRQLLRDLFDGIEPFTGRVMHGGDVVGHVTRRKAGLAYHDLDVSGRYDDTPPARANVSPEVACGLLCIRYVDVEQGGLYSNASKQFAAYANLTSLQALFDAIKERASGTGTFSGDPVNA